MEYIQATNSGNAQTVQVSTRCPRCGREGTFNAIGTDLNVASHVSVGHRVCPNLECLCHLFVVLRNRALYDAHPPVRIDFESADIPEVLVTTVGEAITCHAHGCFTASAILVRRGLEQLCHERGVSSRGENDRRIGLSRRLNLLQEAESLPPILNEALHELRILGNDAAHVESEAYESISAAEVEDALAIFKEILKRIFQTERIVTRLRARRKDVT